MKFRVTFYFETDVHEIEARDSTLAELWAREQERQMVREGPRHPVAHTLEVIE
jgi:hypothetical protein